MNGKRTSKTKSVMGKIKTMKDEKKTQKLEMCIWLFAFGFLFTAIWSWDIKFLFTGLLLGFIAEIIYVGK